MSDDNDDNNDDREKRKKNLEEKKRKVREASPSGTLGGYGGGASGVKGSQQATGGGTTVIVYDPKSGKTALVDLTKLTRRDRELLERGRQITVQERAKIDKERKAKEEERLKRIEAEKLAKARKEREKKAQEIATISAREEAPGSAEIRERLARKEIQQTAPVVKGVDIDLDRGKPAGGTISEDKPESTVYLTSAEEVIKQEVKESDLPGAVSKSLFGLKTVGLEKEKKGDPTASLFITAGTLIEIPTQIAKTYVLNVKEHGVIEGGFRTTTDVIKGTFDFFTDPGGSLQAETPTGRVAEAVGIFGFGEAVGRPIVKTAQKVAEAKAQPKTKKLVTFEPDPKKLTAEEYNFLKKVEDVPEVTGEGGLTKSQLKRLEESASKSAKEYKKLGIKTSKQEILKSLKRSTEVAKKERKAVEIAKGEKIPEDAIIIDLNKVKPKDLKRVVKLQKEGKIKGEVELEIKKKGDLPESDKVGFVYRTKYEVGAETVAERSQISEKFLKIYGKESAKARASFEYDIAQRQQSVTSPELESFIRKEMKRTGKTAKEIYTDIEGVKPKEGIKEFIRVKKKKGKKTVEETQAPRGADFESVDLGVGGFKDLYPSQQKAVLIEEVPVTRGAKPIEVIELPGISQIRQAGIIAISGKVGSGVARAVKITGETKTGIRSQTDIISGVKEEQISQQKQREAEQQKQRQEQRQEQGTIQDQIQEQRQRTRQRQEQIQRLKLETRLKGIFQTKVKAPFDITIPIDVEDDKGIKKDRFGIYKVEVRKKGIFEEVGTFKSPEEAIIRGREEVRRTASASFRVKPIRGRTDISTKASGLLPSQEFRRSKIEPDVFVQRRSKRISSPGEKGEITFKGLATLKARRRF